MFEETRDNDYLDPAWRNVELILKVDSVAKDFSEDAMPQIEARLKERYSLQFSMAREQGKTEEEAHRIAMSRLDDTKALKSEFAATFLTKQENDIASQPWIVHSFAYLQAKICAAITIGLYWSEWSSPIHPAAENIVFHTMLAVMLGLAAITLTVLLFIKRKRRNIRNAFALSILGGVIWTLFYTDVFFIFGGRKQALAMLLLSVIPTGIGLQICRRIYARSKNMASTQTPMADGK